MYYTPEKRHPIFSVLGLFLWVLWSKVLEAKAIISGLLIKREISPKLLKEIVRWEGQSSSLLKYATAGLAEGSCISLARKVLLACPLREIGEICAYFLLGSAGPCFAFICRIRFCHRHLTIGMPPHALPEILWRTPPFLFCKARNWELNLLRKL